MATISFFASLFLSTFLLHFCFYYGVGAADPASSTNGEAFEIVGGRGSNYPENKNCHPPPPPKPKCPPKPPPPKPKCPPKPPPPKPKCPPPLPLPPPPPPEPECPPPSGLSPRLELVYPIIHDFKNKIRHDPKGILNSWDPNEKDVCKYEGFSCAIVPDYNQLAVSGVDFNSYQFAGEEGEGLPLSEFIEKLPDITVFHANSNNFTGGIPKEIFTLRYFYELDLSNNNLAGQFPIEVLGAKNLTFLDLRFNHLYGTVPPQVFLLDVDVIFINNNKFEQRLPDNLGSTPALYLTFANNNFTGPIPSSIGQASKTLLEVLFLNNKLTGCLPFQIGFLEAATVFDASINCLTGPIPPSFQCLFKIEVLNLAQNQLYGFVPEAICKLPNLGIFNLSDNYFTLVGPECRKLINEKVLDVEKNCIIDLPNQRSKAECAAFYFEAKYRRCPNEQSLNQIPCEKYHSAALGSSYHQPTVPAPSPLSYGALKPHRL